MDENGDGLDV